MHDGGVLAATRNCISLCVHSLPSSRSSLSSTHSSSFDIEFCRCFCCIFFVFHPVHFKKFWEFLELNGIAEKRSFCDTFHQKWLSLSRSENEVKGRRESFPLCVRICSSFLFSFLFFFRLWFRRYVNILLRSLAKENFFHPHCFAYSEEMSSLVSFLHTMMMMSPCMLFFAMRIFVWVNRIKNSRVWWVEVLLHAKWDACSLLNFNFGHVWVVKPDALLMLLLIKAAMGAGNLVKWNHRSPCFFTPPKNNFIFTTHIPRYDNVGGRVYDNSTRLLLFWRRLH